MENLNINYHTYNKHLTKGTYYLKRYLFSKVFEPNAIYKSLTLLEFADRLAKDRKKVSLGSSGVAASHTTLVKRLNTDLSYKGYLCKTVNNK